MVLTRLAGLKHGWGVGGGGLKDRSQGLLGVRRPPREDWLPLLYVMVNVSTLFS